MSPTDFFVVGVLFLGGAFFAQFNAFERFLMLVLVVMAFYIGCQMVAGHGLTFSISHAVLALISIQLGYFAGIVVSHFRSNAAPRAPSVKEINATVDQRLEDHQDVVRFHDQTARSAKQRGASRGRTLDV